MAKCDLKTLYDAVLRDVREARVERKSVRFSESILPAPPETLRTCGVICKKDHNGYGGAHRVDALSIYASAEIFQLLGLWILSVVFHAKPDRSVLSLNHDGTEIKELVCDFKHNGTHWGQDVLGYSAIPSRFFYASSELSRFPWQVESVPTHDLPILILTNEDDFVMTDEQAAQRDRIVGFGNDRGTIRFAELLLNLGAQRNEGVEVDLEGELGFRGVGPGSVEIRLVTPETERWLRIEGDYPGFGEE